MNSNTQTARGLEQFNEPAYKRYENWRNDIMLRTLPSRAFRNEATAITMIGIGKILELSFRAIDRCKSLLTI